MYLCHRLVCIYAPPNDMGRQRVNFFLDLNNNVLNDDFDLDEYKNGDINQFKFTALLQ